MKRTIIDLWNEDISPITNCRKSDPEIENLTELIGRNCEDLKKTLTEKQKEILDKYVGCVDEYLDLMTEQSFYEGFSLSSKLLTEAFF